MDDDDGRSSGSAYVYRYDSGEEEWGEEQKLTASDAALGDRFGSSERVELRRSTSDSMISCCTSGKKRFPRCPPWTKW